MQLIKGFPSTMGDDYPLNSTTLIRHSVRTYPSQEIVYRSGDTWERYTYADCFERIGRVVAALRALGVEPGDRVGVLGWNDHRFFELYYAIPSIGAVMVLLNQRLCPDDLGFVIAHSQLSFIAVDETLVPLAEAIAARSLTVRGWIALSSRPQSDITTTLSPLYHYEEALSSFAPLTDWPMIDERSAYAACYTTGTTGQPKGVYYSHRSIYLHTMALAIGLNVTPDDCCMIIAPMFHAQSWGFPQVATLMATKIVLPGRYTLEDAPLLIDAIIREGVTVTNGAPAILMSMLRYVESLPRAPDLHRLRLICGASEPPLAMMQGFHALTGADDRELPHDGRAVGEICLRGPWITARYHDLPESDGRFIDGYWRSGDVGSIDSEGYLKITDRSLVALKPGHETTSEQLREHLRMTFAKWQLPDEVLFVDSIPKTSVGKIDKKVIRSLHAQHYT